MQWTSNCDVAIREALDQFLESAHHTLGRVDILVNNATAFGFADDETGSRRRCWNRPPARRG